MHIKQVNEKRNDGKKQLFNCIQSSEVMFDDALCTNGAKQIREN